MEGCMLTVLDKPVWCVMFSLTREQSARPLPVLWGPQCVALYLDAHTNYRLFGRTSQAIALTGALHRAYNHSVLRQTLKAFASAA